MLVWDQSSYCVQPTPWFQSPWADYKHIKSHTQSLTALPHRSNAVPHLVILSLMIDWWITLYKLDYSFYPLIVTNMLKTGLTMTTLTPPTHFPIIPSAPQRSCHGNCFKDDLYQGNDVTVVDVSSLKCDLWPTASVCVTVECLCVCVWVCVCVEGVDSNGPGFKGLSWRVNWRLVGGAYMHVWSMYGVEYYTHTHSHAEFGAWGSH